jgi:AbrB family looped-hinge helix DNA binding protein
MMKISTKRQIAIPKKIMETLDLKPGDEVEFELEKGKVRLVPTKTIKIPRDQAWFWTPEWQAREKEADRDLKEGDFKDFKDLDSLLKDLHGHH